MNKCEFLDALRNALIGLPDDDVQKSLDFYSEMIDDKVEDGFSEQEAVTQTGNIEDIAKQILMDTPITKLVKQKIKPKRRISALEIVLLILGSPIWVSLLVALITVIFSVYIVLWSLIISLYAVSVSVAVCAISGILVFPIFAFIGTTVQGVFIIGCGLICAGLSILMIALSNLATKGILWLSRKMWFGIKRCFIKRGDYNENC